MGYSENPADVRVDFFKESGKWYATEAVRWAGKWKQEEQPLYLAFEQTLRDHLKTESGYRYKDMFAVCLHPCHENAYPQMIRVKQLFENENKKEIMDALVLYFNGDLSEDEKENLKHKIKKELPFNIDTSKELSSYQAELIRAGHTTGKN